jgi:heme-degrading monooxygenase HmoA
MVTVIGSLTDPSKVRGVSVVKINAISVPDGAGVELERRFAARAGAVEGAPGFLGFQLLRPTAGESRYFVVTHWESEEAFAAWRDGDARSAHATAPGEEPRRPVSTGADLLEFEVVLDVRPG